MRIDFVGGSSREIVVEPIVVQVGRRNLGAIGRNGAEMIIGKAAHVVTGSVAHGQILAVEALPLEARSVIEVELRGHIPIVRGIKRQFVFVSLVVFGGILVVIVEIRAALVPIEET